MTEHPLGEPLGYEKYAVGQCQENKPRMSVVQASESNFCETRVCNGLAKSPSHLQMTYQY